MPRYDFKCDARTVRKLLDRQSESFWMTYLRLAAKADREGKRLCFKHNAQLFDWVAKYRSTTRATV